MRLLIVLTLPVVCLLVESRAASAGDVAAEPAATVPFAVPQPCVTSSPKDSYAAVTERYPAPAHSLVPFALLSGPRFRGAGDWTGAYVRGTHIRYPYYSYRSPWTYAGPGSVNHTIHW